MDDRAVTEEEFWAILTAPSKPVSVFYRLYYNDDGTPICYSMEDLPHNYIELTAEQYHQSPPNVRVINGQMVVIKPPVYIKKLVPGTEGLACDPRDICVVVREDQPHINWSIKSNEAN
jgi:hypothetical protein